MLQDVIHPPDQFPMESMSSPTDTQILELCNTGELSQETPWKLPRMFLCSACGGRSCGRYCNNINGCSDAASFDRTFFSSIDTSPLAALLDAKNHTFSDLSSSPQTQMIPSSFVKDSCFSSDDLHNQFNQILLRDAILSGYTLTSESRTMMTQLKLSGSQQQQLPPPLALEETNCMMTIPEYMGLQKTQSLIDESISSLFNGSANMPSLSAEGMFPRSVLLRSEEAFQKADLLNYQAESGDLSFYRTDKKQHDVYSSSDIQALVGDQQFLGAEYSALTSLPSSPLEESNFRAGRLSPEERKERINRYLKKRHERNFSKKIKYACRKTLADSRPRVRGRFAKNEDFGESPYDCDLHSHHDEDEEQAVSKEEDTCSEFFPQLNSFKLKYTLKSSI